MQYKKQLHQKLEAQLGHLKQAKAFKQAIKECKEKMKPPCDGCALTEASYSMSGWPKRNPHFDILVSVLGDIPEAT